MDALASAAYGPEAALTALLRRYHDRLDLELGADFALEPGDAPRRLILLRSPYREFFGPLLSCGRGVRVRS